MTRKEERRLRVLIVDDEPRLRDMLWRSVEEMGFAAEVARSAEQARRTLAERPVDVLILDLNLPGQGGLELLEQLRSATPSPEVIILTGFGSLDAARRAIRLDVADFLTKPCTLDDLEQALGRARSRLLATRQPKVAPEPAAEAKATLEELERVHILAALDRNNGNRAATAAELGISERTLYYRLSQYQRLGLG